MAQLAEMLRGSERLDLPRLVGAVLLATGVLLIELRKGDDWGDFGLFLVAAVPCLALYALVLAVARPGAALETWQTGLSIVGIVLGLVALLRLMQWLGASKPLPGAGATFLVTLAIAIVAGYIAFQFRSPIHTLIAAGLLVICYFALLDWSGANLSLRGTRDNLAGITVAYWVAAYMFRRHDRLERDHSHYAVLAGGVTGVYAGAIGVGFSSILEGISSLFGFSTGESNGWEFFLLAVSVLLIFYAAWQEARTATWLCAYVGIAGLLLFLFFNLTSASLGGWPIWLTIIGAAVVIGSLFGRKLAGTIEGAPPGGQAPASGDNAPPPAG